MKLLSCYISAFGCLEDKSITFTDGLNSFYMENGEGKSTLAAFIRAMLYGLPKTTTKSFEREHYLPFDGHLCSGRLVFLHEGKEYEIERSFGKKPSDDDLKVYLDKMPTGELGEIPGETIFGLSMESFSRTMFIHSSDLEVSSPSEVKAKMSHYVEDTGSSFSLEDVLKKLEDYKKDLKPKNSSDEKGKIAEKKAEIKETEYQVENLKTTLNGLPAKYERSRILSDELEKLKEELKQSSRKNEIIASWKRYDDYTAKILNQENKITEIMSHYPEGMPAAEDVKDMEAALDALLRLEAERNARLMDKKDEKRIVEYSSRFKEGTPSDEEISGCTANITEYASLPRNRKEEFTDSEIRILKKYESSSLPDDFFTKLDEAHQKYQEALRLHEATPSEIYQDQIKTEATKKKSLLPVFLAAMGALILIAGIVLGIFKPILFTIAGAGALLLAGAGFLYLLNQMKQVRVSTSEKILVPNPKKSKTQEGLTDAKILCDTLIMPFGFSSAAMESLDNAVASFRTEYARFEELKAKKDKILKEEEAIRQKEFSLKGKIDSFFQKYPASGSGYQGMMLDLQSGMKEYDALLLRKEQSEESIKSTDAEIQRLKENISVFKRRYSAPDDLKEYFDDLKNQRGTLKEAKDALNETRSEALAFKKANDLTERPSDEESADAGLLTGKISQKSGELKTLEDEIAMNEAEAERKDRLEEKILQMKRELEVLNHQLKIVTAVMDSLKSSEISLKHRYIEPMLTGFNHYMNLLGKDVADQMEMDADYNLQLIREGLKKDCRHLSTGQLSLCALCYRLAIMDNVYGDAKPFLVLDDIFVNLDEKNLQKAKELVKKLCEERQVLYFTCHESRTME